MTYDYSPAQEEFLKRRMEARRRKRDEEEALKQAQQYWEQNPVTLEKVKSMFIKED